MCDSLQIITINIHPVVIKKNPPQCVDWGKKKKPTQLCQLANASCQHQLNHARQKNPKESAGCLFTLNVSIILKTDVYPEQTFKCTQHHQLPLLRKSLCALSAIRKHKYAAKHGYLSLLIQNVDCQQTIQQHGWGKVPLTSDVALNQRHKYDYKTTNNIKHREGTVTDKFANFKKQSTKYNKARSVLNSELQLVSLKAYPSAVKCVTQNVSSTFRKTFTTNTIYHL